MGRQLTDELHMIRQVAYGLSISKLITTYTDENLPVDLSAVGATLA